jgi:hypothetical protein
MGLPFIAAPFACVDALTTGRATINSIAINILDAAVGADKTLIDLKVSAASKGAFRRHAEPEGRYADSDAARWCARRDRAKVIPPL